MTAVKRFFYAMSSGGGKLHVCFANNFAEGTRARCGVLIRAKWLWFLGRLAAPRTAKVCKSCRPT